MRILKLFVISVIVLFGVVSFLFMLFPSDIRISRVISIRGNKGEIAGVIADVKTWEKWNLFIHNAELPHPSYSIPSSGKGAYIQGGPIQITLMGTSTDSIKTAWEKRGSKPFNSTFSLVQHSGENVILQWYFDFHFKWYPWEKLGSMFYDRQMGPVMEGSLVNLKHLIENNQ